MFAPTSCVEYGDRRDVPQFLRANLGTRHKDIAISGSHTIPSLLGLAVARFARVVIVDVPHHVTQRGNARQVIRSSDRDRTTVRPKKAASDGQQMRLTSVA
jgi:hypothetical protein